jgi:methylmalonyl-CoA/ethylmalonyl-CoA epimerase
MLESAEHERTMSTKPLFRKITQIGIVVRDSEVTARHYWDDFGIGPWRFYTLDPTNTPNMRFRGRPVQHSFRAALATVGEVTLELIEPLDGASVYSEHLQRHGEGLHHLAFAVDDYESARKRLNESGFGELQSGRPYDVNDYAYFDTAGALGFITEIYSADAPGKSFPPPERTLPAAGGQHS